MLINITWRIHDMIIYRFILSPWPETSPPWMKCSLGIVSCSNIPDTQTETSCKRKENHRMMGKHRFKCQYEWIFHCCIGNQHILPHLNLEKIILMFVLYNIIYIFTLYENTSHMIRILYGMIHIIKINMITNIVISIVEL